MPFLPAIYAAYVLSGFGVGFLVGMTGVGGGALMTPLLILLFHIHPVAAVGTDLLYASVTKTGGTIVHSFNKAIDWCVVGRLATGSLPASALTLGALYAFHVDTASANMLIANVLGVALLATALALVFRPWLLRTYARRVGVLAPERTRNLTILTGFALGVLVTISSVGAGALGVTALILLYPELPVVRIAGSDIAHAVPLTLLAGIGHLMTGAIDLSLLELLLLGSIPGIVISSLFAPRLPDAALRIILAATLFLVAIKMLS